MSVFLLFSFPHTKETAMICEHFGLDSLNEGQYDYNIKLVKKFFTTLVIGVGTNIPFSWMTNNQMCHSDFVRFAQQLGCPLVYVDEPVDARILIFDLLLNKEYCFSNI